MPDRTTSLRVAIAEDNALVRDGLIRQLEYGGMTVAGAYDGADELLANLATDEPDIVILDIRLPPGQSDEGIRAAREVRRERPWIGILVLSTYCEPSYAEAVVAIDTEGLGYLVKDRVTSAATLLDAVQRVHDRGYVIDPEVVQVLLGRTGNRTTVGALTAREHTVMHLVAEGLSNSKIAEQLHLSVRTVEGNTSLIFDKLGLPQHRDTNRRVQAVLAWLQGRDPIDGTHERTP